MKSPTSCPCCKGILLHEFIDKPNGSSTIKKTCDKYLNHKIKTFQYTDLEQLFGLEIEIDSNSKTKAYFSYSMNMIFVYRGDKLKIINALQLPFFEPNLKDYVSVVNKIKIYTWMS